MAVDVAADIFTDIRQCDVLVIGAGKIGRVVAKNLVKTEVRNIFIANRDVAKAVQIAAEVEGTALPLTQIKEYIGKVDIIISGTGSPDYLLHYDELAQLLAAHAQRHFLMVDIAMPRDFDPKIAEIPNVSLKNLYDLKEIVDRNLKQREEEIPIAKQIIAEEVRKYLNWKESLKINSTIKALNKHFETIRETELERYQRQFPEDMLPQVETFTKSLTKKYIHLIVSNLKSLHEICELDSRQIHILQHLFDNEGTIHERTHCRLKRQ